MELLGYRCDRTRSRPLQEGSRLRVCEPNCPSVSPDERGRFLGTANGISFAFLSLASLIYWIIRPAFGSSPEKIFLLCAGLMIAGSAFFLARLRRALFEHGIGRSPPPKVEG